MARVSDSLTERQRFERIVIRDNDCHIFKHNLSQGYGRFTLRIDDPARRVFERKQVSAHIFSWYLATGMAVRSVWMRCGNKLCVRTETPAHLFIPTDKERFYLHINEDGPIEYPHLGPCHEWKAKGHTFWAMGKCWEASRYAWFMNFGEIPKGVNVLHRCDNRKCVNLKHLYLGTQKQNIADMISRGRAAWVRGARSPNSRISEAQVRLVRQLVGRPAYPDELAVLLDVEVETIKRVLRNQTYVDAEPKEESKHE